MTPTAPPASPGSPWLEMVRPGRDAQMWLRQTIRDLKASDPFRPITVLVPNDYAGRLARWQLARDGGYLNVTTRRLPSLAAALASDAADVALHRIVAIIEESAVREAIRTHGLPFQTINHRSLHVVLLDLFRELRRREIELTPDDLTQLTDTTKAAWSAYGAFSRLIDRYDTATSIVQKAASLLDRAVSCPVALERLGSLIVWLPSRLDPAEARLLAAAARWVPLAAALIDAGQSSDPIESPGRQAAQLLATALRIDPPPRLERDRAIGGDLAVIRVPDPAEEVREVVRAIASELHNTIPLYRIAIVYRQDDPYAALVRETLDSAGLPWVSSEGIRLTRSRPGRCLLGLLALPDRAFTREAVMEWLETGPYLEEHVRALPTATWDRLTRQASVVRGADQWDSRLRALAATREAEADDLDRADRNPTQVDGHRRQAAEARTIAGVMVDLAGALKPPDGAASWGTFVSWARGLRDRFVGRPEVWPVAQQSAAREVDEVLISLGQADTIAWSTQIELPTFIASLEGALDGKRVPTGTVGQGILVEPITALNGLTFDRVYLLGLVDGSFPPTPAADPFFPAGGPDPLDRRARQVAKERQDFLVALASADGGRLTLTVPDSDGERAAIPSRWLLEAIRGTYGLVLDASKFKTLSEKDHGWLKVIQSAQQAAARAAEPADLEDRRLADVARWTRQGQLLGRHPLAQRGGMPLRRAIEQLQARRGGALSRFDGNLSERAATARKLGDLIGSDRPISASAIQSWASCGYRYFLERVIRVEPTEQPEESPTIDALERGTLIHKILENFLGELARVNRPGWSESYGPSDLARMNRIAFAEFAELERRGVTGHPLVWENTRGSILSDLGSFLTVDAAWRSAEKVRPSRFEQTFGMGTSGDDPWPALGVPVEDGALLFRGMIDRIDLDASGRRAFVFDYKTGSAGSYAALAEDPVAAGQHIQLALYSQVVRANLPGVVAVDSAFWFISARGEFKRLDLNAEADAVDRRLALVLGTITRGIRTGAFPRVTGALDNGVFANCRNCDFDRICPVRRDQAARDTATDPMVLLHASLGGSTDGGDEE